MELIDYRGVLRRWSVLIIAGTLVAALVGYRVALRSQETAHPRYAGTASVVVNYVTPPGVPYIPTLSIHTQTDVLSARVYDPGVLSRVAARAHVALSQVQRVSTAVNPQMPLITIRVLGTTPHAAAAVAQGLAQYLAGVETQQVQAQAASLIRTAASAAAQAQQRWLAAQARYYVVCGCMAGQHQAQLGQRPPSKLPQPSKRPPPRLTRRPAQQLSRQPAPRFTRRPAQSLSRRPSPQSSRRPPRSPSRQPALRLSRRPRHRPNRQPPLATAVAPQTATATVYHTATAAAPQAATAAAVWSAAAVAQSTATEAADQDVTDMPTLSMHTQTDVLSARVYDPGVLSRVAARAQVALSYLICGCLAGQHQAQLGQRPPSKRPPPQPGGQPADPTTLAQLRAELDLLQANYAAAAARYTALQSNPVPVATVIPGSVSVVQTPATSPLKAVLLATVIGLVLSSGLAVLLDYRWSGLPALARARDPEHAASPLPDPPLAGASGGSGSARRAHAARRDSEPAATHTPGSRRPLKGALSAVGLGLLACIGLAALLVDGRTVPLSVASHVGARHVRLEVRRRPPAVTQPVGPLATLPAPPALLLNPDAVHFNHHDGPTRRTAHTIYVVNVGPAPVTIRTITITGADRAAFAEADTCTRSTVRVYGRCTINVRVAHTTGGGTRKATLVITANTPGSPQRVPLST